MKWNIILLIIGGIIILSLVSAEIFSTEEIESLGLGNLSIDRLEPQWNFVQHTGLQLESFNISKEDLGNGKARICLSPIIPMKSNNPIIVETRAYLFKNKTLMGVVESDDMEKEKEGGNVKKMCINIDRENERKVKFGNSTTVIVYQNIKRLSYDTGNCNVNVTLFKLIDGSYENNVNKIYI